MRNARRINMKKTIVLLLAVLLILGAGFWSLGSCYAAFPFPSSSGASGLTRIPDAQALPYKNWNIGVDYGVQKLATGDQPVISYKANLGAFHNFELGMVGGLDAAGKELRDGVYINLKYSPSIGDGSDPLLLAIGINNLASKTQTDVYMVATKPLNQGPLLSFGFMADFPNSKFRPMGMAGIDIPFGTLSAIADLMAGETIFQLNGGVRFRLLPTFALEARAINILANQPNAQQAKDPQQFLVGVSWINPF